MGRVERIQDDDFGSSSSCREDEVVQSLRCTEQMTGGPGIDQQMMVGGCTEATPHDQQAADERPTTKKNLRYQGDEVVSVSQFASSMFDADAYRDILRAFIYPPISELKIVWHAGSEDPSKGIASIYVPPSSASEKPYLVAQIELDSQVRGHIFGYFERVGDDVLPMTVQVIRDTMKDGKRYASLERRMESFEGLLAKIVSNRSVTRTSLTSERLLQRAADAKIAALLADTPSFFLLAAPLEPVRLTGLFSSRSAANKAISEPPVYRHLGFDINPHAPVEYVRGELIRRVTNGRKGLELWQDGTLIFVGRNDEDFLGWAVKRKEEENRYINNYVLTEVVSLFFVLAVQVFSDAQDPSQRVKVVFGFMQQKAEAETYELSPHEISQQFGSFPGKRIPADNKTFWIDFELKDAVPEIEALRLLKEIYHCFGITDEQIPYVDSKSVPERVDRARYA